MQKNQPLEGIVPNSKFEEKYVEADGFRIRFKEAGQGVPPGELRPLYLRAAHIRKPKR